MSAWIDPLKNDRFPFTVSKEVFDMLCGAWLGEGIGRNVYECAYDETCVVKIEDTKQSFQNVMEWDLWKAHHAHGTSVCDWLAPCVRLSPSGLVLIQKRTKPVPFDFELPKYVPNVLCSDMKRANWGIYKNRLVCHDYGRHEAISEASIGKNMARACWFDTKGRRFNQPYQGHAS